MDIDPRPGHLLHALVHKMDQAADVLLQEHVHISYRRAYVLFTIQRLGAPSQIELANALGYSRASVTTMLSSLSNTGYVKVSNHPTHGKKQVVALTSEGSRIVTATIELLDREFSKVFADSSVNEEEYRVLTKRLYTAISTKTKENDH
jgi:DNA-binding MarR family transcriptional regulator